MALCAPVFAQNASDFKTDGRGTITGYNGWDTNIVIPERIGNVPVRAIGDGAFKSMGLTRITLPAGISIGENAFENNQLTSLTLGDSVVIGQNAFSQNKLTSLTVGNDVAIVYQAFSGNPLSSITMGDRILLGNRAFGEDYYGYNTPSTKLTSLIIGSNGLIDEDNVFQVNNSTKIVLGANNRIYRDNFGESVFYNYMCNDRKAGTYGASVTYTAKTEGDYKFIETRYGAVIISYSGKEGNRLIIPKTLNGAAVKGIGDGTNSISNNIGRMQLPEGITFIEANAFSSNQLTNVSIPNGVTLIGGYAFAYNQLTNVTIPNSVVFLGIGAFYGNQLTSVSIPGSINIIRYDTFASNQLTSVTIPNGITRINNCAFYSNQLTSVTIPDSVVFIGTSAFSGNQLTSITIGNNVSLISEEKNSYYTSFDNFDNFYNTNGKKSGTYVLRETGRTMSWNMR